MFTLPYRQKEILSALERTSKKQCILNGGESEVLSGIEHCACSQVLPAQRYLAQVFVQSWFIMQINSEQRASNSSAFWFEYFVFNVKVYGMRCQ